MSWVNLPQIVLFAIAGVFLLPAGSPHLSVPASGAGKYSDLLAFTLRSTPPPLYAMGYIGSGRQINIYCYSSYWCIFLQSSITGSTGSKHPFRAIRAARFFLLYHPTGQLSFWQASSCWPSVWGDRRILCPLQRLTSGKAITAIVDGSADRHEQAYQERLELLLTPSDVCVLPGLLPPCPPFEDDLLAASEDDGEYWQNEALAEYFNHKRSFWTLQADACFLTEQKRGCCKIKMR